MTLDFDGKLGEGLKFYSHNEAIVAFENGKVDLQANIFVKNLKGGISSTTTVGRIIFNNVLPEGFVYQNFPIDDDKMRLVVNSLIYGFGFEEAAGVLDKIKNLGFIYSGLSGIS